MCQYPLYPDVNRRIYDVIWRYGNKRTNGSQVSGWYDIYCNLMQNMTCVCVRVCQIIIRVTYCVIKLFGKSGCMCPQWVP